VIYLQRYNQNLNFQIFLQLFRNFNEIFLKYRAKTKAKPAKDFALYGLDDYFLAIIARVQ
jgi:hypothetical protein